MVLAVSMAVTSVSIATPVTQSLVNVSVYLVTREFSVSSHVPQVPMATDVNRTAVVRMVENVTMSMEPVCVPGDSWDLIVLRGVPREDMDRVVP